MKCAILFSILTAALVHAEPKFVFENRPESGIPTEAERQALNPETRNQTTTLSALVADLASVHVRYSSTAE